MHEQTNAVHTNGWRRCRWWRCHIAVIAYTHYTTHICVIKFLTRNWFCHLSIFACALQCRNIRNLIGMFRLHLPWCHVNTSNINIVIANSRCTGQYSTCTMKTPCLKKKTYRRCIIQKTSHHINIILFSIHNNIMWVYRCHHRIFGYQLETPSCTRKEVQSLWERKLWTKMEFLSALILLFTEARCFFSSIYRAFSPLS